MSLRTVLLHAAHDGGFDDRLALAVNLARQCGATLKAVYTLYPAGVPRVGRALSIYVNELVREARQLESGLRAKFESAAAEAGVRGTWEAVLGEVTSELRDAANFADVTVVSETPAGSIDDQLAATLPEHLAFSCSGPVIVVPTGKPVPARIARVLVAWKPSREAGHAVRFALPLLAVAEKVEVVTVDEGGDPGETGGKLTAWLAAHGVTAEHHHVRASSAGPAIAAEAAAFGADLVVLGAYSRWRLAEQVLGGVTVSMLENPPAALLCAH